MKSYRYGDTLFTMKQEVIFEMLGNFAYTFEPMKIAITYRN